MDLETFFRDYIKRPNITMLAFEAIALNGENRVEITFNTGDKFIVFGDNTLHVPEKSAPQRVAAEGFDAHKGMGDRT